MERRCRCFDPPKGSPFQKEKEYRWDYCIDGYIVYSDCGDRWAFGIDFYWYFQILSGKWYYKPTTWRD